MVARVRRPRLVLRRAGARSGIAPTGLSEAIVRIRRWGEARDWRGYDPYDALNTPFETLLTLGRPLGRRALTQAVKLSPLNLRPVLRIAPTWNGKALALVASGYARLFAADSGDERAHAQASRWLTWLVEHPTAPGSALGWGYPFKVQTRFFGYARETPNAIATSFVIQALLDGHELLGDERWGEAAVGACEFLSRELLFDEEGRTYFCYLPAERELVHNANLLACAAISRTADLVGRESLRETVESALRASLAAQRPDGSWPYAEGAGHAWVDNFHTGYVLESVAICARSLPDLREPLTRGLAYWQQELFLEDGTPKYTPESIYPLDAHCYATAIDTWLAVRDLHPGAMQTAERTARLLLERMLDPVGYVHFQRTRFWTNRVPFVRWTTAPTFRALAGLQLVGGSIGENDRGAGLD
jgi:hypothetical protein